MFDRQPLRPDFRRRRDRILGQLKDDSLELDARSKSRGKIVLAMHAPAPLQADYALDMLIAPTDGSDCSAGQPP